MDSQGMSHELVLPETGFNMTIKRSSMGGFEFETMDIDLDGNDICAWHYVKADNVPKIIEFLKTNGINSSTNHTDIK